MNTPLISVIVPVFNTEPYLRKCLDSVTTQTYENIEIICIDDGSTDNSPAILAEYAARDSRIVIHTQPNAGLSAARNAGLRMARGEWITGLDSDDWIEPDAYEYFYNNNLDETTKLVVMGFDAVNGDTGKRIWKDSLPGSGLEPVTPRIIEKTGAYFWNKFWHRSLFLEGKVKFPEGLWFEDVVIWHKIAPYQSHILFLPEVKYHYARYSGGNSIICKTKERDERNNSLILVSEQVLNYRKEYPLPKVIKETDSWMLEHYYNTYINLYNWDNQEWVWQKYRALVNQHDMLKKICTSPKLALWYALPPCAVDALNKTYIRKDELKNRMSDFTDMCSSQFEKEKNLIINGNKLMFLYRKTQLKCFFSWGKRKLKYKLRLKKMREFVREYRRIKKHLWQHMLQQIKNC